MGIGVIWVGCGVVVAEMAGKVHAFEKILASGDGEIVVVGYAFNPYIILAIYVAAEASIY